MFQLQNTKHASDAACPESGVATDAVYGMAPPVQEGAKEVMSSQR